MELIILIKDKRMLTYVESYSSTPFICLLRVEIFGVKERKLIQQKNESIDFFLLTPTQKYLYELSKMRLLLK